MIDLNAEEPLTLREAARLPFLKRNGRAPHFSQLYRWAKHGLRGIKLETATLPAGMVTTREAVLRFIQRLTNPLANPETRTPTQRQRAIERVDRELREAGI